MPIIEDGLRWSIYCILKKAILTGWNLPPWNITDIFNRASPERRYEYLCSILFLLRERGNYYRAVISEIEIVAAKYKIILPPEHGKCWALPGNTITSIGEQMKCF